MPLDGPGKAYARAESYIRTTTSENEAEAIEEDGEAISVGPRRCGFR